MMGTCGLPYPYCRKLPSHIRCKADKKQWQKAALWYLVICWYHRLGLPAEEVASDLGLTRPKVEKVVLTIAHAGLRDALKPDISSQTTDSVEVTA